MWIMWHGTHEMAINLMVLNFGIIVFNCAPGKTLHVLYIKNKCEKWNTLGDF